MTVTALIEFAPEDNRHLVECLKRLLADNFTAYQHAHGFHWNVKGQDFREYHAFFSEIYGDLFGSLDPTAECLLKIGENAPFGDALAEYRSFNDVMCSDDPIAMTAVLYQIISALNNTTKAAFDAAIDVDDQGIANFLAGRLDTLAKWLWQLRVSAS